MKRTIKEIYDLIVEKRDNAKKRKLGSAKNLAKFHILLGLIEAYQNVLSLIESSGLLEDKPVKGKELEALESVKRLGINQVWYKNELDIIETALKALEIFKRAGNGLEIAIDDDGRYLLQTKDEYCVGNCTGKFVLLFLTKENADILKKVLL